MPHCQQTVLPAAAFLQPRGAPNHVVPYSIRPQAGGNVSALSMAAMLTLRYAREANASLERLDNAQPRACSRMH
jgi:hypothetical protein